MRIPDLLTLPVDPAAKARVIVRIVAVVVGLLMIAGAALWLKARLGEAPAMKAAQTQLDGRVNAAGQASEDSAVAAYADHVRTNETIKEKETHYVETIRSAPGADAPVPDALHSAGIDAIRGLRVASNDDNSAAEAVSR